MTQDLLYLSRAQVEQLAPERSELRDAIAEAVRATAAGQLKFEPKTTLAYATGHSFQCMPALTSDSTGMGVATIKWVSVVPSTPGSKLDNIHSLICVNDLETGQPLAIMDGNYITLVRTAAISALAAQCMYRSNPVSIGFIGCGQQAREHLLAFRDLYPSLEQVFCFSRSEQSARKIADFAANRSMKAQVSHHPDEVLETCDIVISTVPAAAGLKPYLDGRKLKPNALAVMVDLGRSWIAEGFNGFDFIATDSLKQSKHPYDVEGNEIKSVQVAMDLESLINHPLDDHGRKAFFFKGIASGDLAVAALIYERAVSEKTGVLLAR
ncbi:ornithine cyclodeaminase family protein [Ochrobactrum sp. S1502_03]|uniref:ornithine cyclodeaminase family protein n=1 Tax=Ochrobactrum sp. S1502_03 TaxID=3108451 RepID=UPI0037C6DFA7